MVELLSRIQFAFTITFHFIYPPLSIGLSLALIFMEGMYLKTKNPIWEKITRFWVKVFALTFALGVATGIPLQFSLGTNWARYSRFVGDVFGSLLGAEGFFAFLIEAGFLGVLLFGWNRVSPKIHFLSTFFVAFGAHFSAIWIVSTNSWMQAPSGYQLVKQGNETIAKVTNWLDMFLSPTNLSHLTHVLLACWLTGAFLIISVAAYYLLRDRHLEFAKKSMKIGLLISGSCVLLQLVSADNLARKTANHNPEKLAAFEGVYKTTPSTPIYILGWVNSEEQKVYGLRLPGVLSFLVYRSFTKPVPGLDQFPQDQWPWVAAVFQTYHLMVMMWVLMVIGSAAGIYYWVRNRWKMRPIFLWFMIVSVAFPQIANIAGWYSSCMGRQPWIVYKLLKTKDAFSANLTVGQIVGSLTMFVIMYLLFFALFLVLLNRKIQNGPEVIEEELPYRDVYKDKEEKKKK
ncbi:MAG: cytochrome ubiquinol oxidase subunit I [Chlamydiae bacterium]|nr:cytochrome ubiquinol oxidase subunit I [Chlamydiota bacterium]